VAKRKLFSTGDVNPIDYGGGFVFSEPSQGAWLEITHGLDADAVALIEDDPAATPMELYRVSLEETVDAKLPWMDFVNWEKVASSLSITEEEYWREIQLLQESNRKVRMPQANYRVQVRLLEDAAGYYGWHEFDSDPLRLTARALARRWRLRVPT